MKNQDTGSRRRFLKQSCKFAALSYASSLGLFSLASSRVTAAGIDNNYKALVYVFLAGGNDSFNMVAPKGHGSLRTRYEQGRRNIALPSDSLHALQLQSPAQITGNENYSEFGMHPNCGDLARLFNQKELAVVCNVGNLFEPTSRAQYLSDEVRLPPQLFSHSDQQRQFQSEPSRQFRFGWGGRLAELVHGQNADGNVSPLISTSGQNAFQTSMEGVISPYVLKRSGLTRLNGFNGRRKAMVEQIMASGSEHHMAAKIRQTFSSAQIAEDIVGNAFSIADNNGVDYDELFAPVAESNIGQQLKIVAKMIAGKSAANNNRPVYFVKMGGFDNHRNLLADHASLMAELNAALTSFRNALVAQGDFDCTLTTIGSEFGRTFTPNGNDADAGTDHAWGGNALVMGGMVDGGRFYGQYPDLKLGESLDTDRRRGRWIPTTSTSQYCAVIAHWFGVAPPQLNTIFPSLDNFPDPLSASANLQFIKGDNV